MISAQNHRQQLNGNKELIFLFLMVSLISCSVPKQITENKDVQIVTSGTTVEKNKKTSSEIITKTDVVKNGEIQKTQQNKNSKFIKIDTVKWVDVSYKFPAISWKELKPVEFREGYDFKDKYNVKILIPLNSDENEIPYESRFVHFYAGVLRGLETLDDEGVRLDIKVIDTEEGNLKVSENMNEILDDSTDLVIGPFEREDVKVFADQCKLKSIPLVSPWQTSTKITYENPYYIQMKPNLKEHFLKLASTTSLDYKKGEVAIIGRNNKETISWINFFNESTSDLSDPKDFFTSYFVLDDSLKSGTVVFNKLYKSNVKAVIIPNYSYNDEGFIYSCLRKLSAERAGKQISVYGMPILFDSDKIDFDFYHSLNMNVVMSDFIDQDHGQIREFRRDFLNMYGEIPTSEAVKAYDLILYLGRNLWKYGRNFQNYLENEPASYLESSYQIQKATSEDSPIINDPSKFDYFENKHLDIIEFKGNKWQKKN